MNDCIYAGMQRCATTDGAHPRTVHAPLAVLPRVVARARRQAARPVVLVEAVGRDAPADDVESRQANGEECDGCERKDDA